MNRPEQPMRNAPQNTPGEEEQMPSLIEEKRQREQLSRSIAFGESL